MIFGIVFKTELMKFLGATSTILPYANDFAHYILIASPIMCCSFVLNILLRSQGKANLSMIGLSIGGILNIILEPIFIFVLKMGIGGAAIATLISQSVSFLILISIYFSHKNLAKIKLNLCFLSFKKFFVRICRGGSSSLVRQGLVVVANVLLNIQAKSYGDAAIAGISITNRVFLLVISIMFGLGQGFQPIAVFCYGAKRLDRVKKSFLFTLVLSTIIQIIFSFLLFNFSQQIVEIFQKNTDVVKVGSNAIRFFAVSLSFLPLSIITNMLFQVIGHYKKSLFLSSCRQGIFFLPLIILLPHFFGLTGIELCQPISNALSGIIAIPFIIHFLVLNCFILNLPYTSCFWKVLFFLN